MNIDINNSTVLVAPLNWGLGHAARCVPVINKLLANNCTVIIASDGNALQFLKTAFPLLQYYELPGYNIQYPANKKMTTSLLWQFLLVPNTIKKEHNAITKIVAIEKPQYIISDNRYGVFHTDCTNIIITHQLSFKFEGIEKTFETLANSIVQHYVNKFNECWIPDFENEKQNFTGLLSSPKLKITKKYIGVLSSLYDASFDENTIPLYDFCIIITGPEKQRTLFENMILEKLISSTYTAIVVRSSVLPLLPKYKTKKIQYINFANSNEVAQCMQQSQFVVSRAGYTTIMDLCFVNKKCLLIPTPNQPEQEYLSSRLKNFNLALIQNQNEISFENIENKMSAVNSIYNYQQSIKK